MGARTNSLLPRLQENEFRDQVVQLAKLYQWRVYWTWKSVHSPKGYPDLSCVKSGRHVYLELKVGRRQPTWEQRQWLEDLAQVPGTECYVVRPEDFKFIRALFGGDVQEHVAVRISS